MLLKAKQNKNLSQLREGGRGITSSLLGHFHDTTALAV